MTWENVTLNEFMSCKENLANNRQTRMLAEYDSVISLCQPDLKFKNNDIYLLNKAKKALNSMIYFAINEYQVLSGKLFEKSFGDGLFQFEVPFFQSNITIADKYFNGNATEKIPIDKIKQLNYLDMELYDYAVRLFFKRLRLHKIKF